MKTLDFTLISAIFFLSVISNTAVRASEASCSAEFRQLEQDIPSLYLINGLFLSKEQNDKLAALLKKAEKVHASSEAQMERLEKSFRSHLARKTGRDPSKQQRKAIREDMKAMREVNDSRHDRLRDLAIDVYSLLAPAQREIIDGFEPCFIPAKDFREPVRVGQAANDTKMGEKMFERLRMVPDHRLELAKERALKRMVPYVMHKRHIKYTPEAKAEVEAELAANLDAVLPRLRQMNDVDFELEKANLVNKVMPTERVRPSYTKNTDYEGALIKISRYVLNPGVVDIVSSRGTAKSTRLKTAGTIAANNSSAQDKLRATRVIAGLGLTPTQIDKILPIVRNGTAARKQLEDKAIQIKQDGLPAYHTLRKELAGQNPTEEAERNSNHYHNSIKQLYESDLVEALRPYENQLDHLLTAEQVSRLATKGTPQQASQTKKPGTQQERRLAMETLDEARDMNPAEFERSKQDLAKDFVRSCVIYDKDGSAVDTDYETQRAIRVLKKARSLSRITFRKNKPDLSVELCPRRSTPREVSYSHKFAKGQPLEELDSTSLLLFSETAVQVLTELAKK